MHALIPLVMTLLAAADPVPPLDVQGGAGRIALDGGYVRLDANTTGTLTVHVDKDGEIVVDVVRLGRVGDDGSANLTLTIGRARQTFSTRATVVAERAAGKVFASRPVRRRWPVSAGDVPVDITTDAAVGVRVVWAPPQPSGKPSLVPMQGAPVDEPVEILPEPTKVADKSVPVAPPTRGQSVPVVSAPRPAPRAAVTTSPTLTKAPDVTQVPPPPQVDKGTFERQLATPTATATQTPLGAVTTSTPPASSPTASPDAQTPPPETTARHAAVATPAPAAATTPEASVTTSRAPWSPQPRLTRDASFPAVMAELHMAGSMMTGGLSPLVGSGGVAVLMGPQSGDLDGAALGFAFDVDLEQALTHNARWYAISHRARLEGQWLWPLDVGGGDVRWGFSGGVGIALGTHSIDTLTAHKDVVTFGPTARVMPQIDIGSGPGLLFAGVALDATVDVTDAVHHWAPLAAGLLVGYRLTL